MKRQDIISKLMNEGFTQKTLVNLNDKQLHMLAERVLSEQYAATTTTTGIQPGVGKGIKMVPAEKTKDAMNKRETFMAYEGEVKEQKLGAEKKEKTEDEKTLQKIHHKIETKMKKGECIKSEVELLKRMKKNVPEKLENYIKSKEKKLKKEVAEQTAKIKKLPEEPSQKPTTKPISNVPVVDGGNKKLKTWVNKLVESKYFTSKNEIMELVQIKLNEQPEPDVIERPQIMPDPPSEEEEWEKEKKKRDNEEFEKWKEKRRIPIPSKNSGNNPQKEASPEKEVETDPDKRTGTPDYDPDQDNPFKVQPGIKIKPKAKTEISAEDAKNKIIDLMIKNL